MKADHRDVEEMHLDASLDAAILFDPARRGETFAETMNS